MSIGILSSKLHGYALTIILLVVVLSTLTLSAPDAVAQNDSDTIIVRGDNNYPPFEYLDENGEPAGYTIDIVRAIARVMNLPVSIRLGPWDEVREQLETGRIDAISGMYYSADRDKMVDFTVSHLDVSYSLFVRKGSQIESIADAAGAAIVVQNGDIAHDFLLKSDIPAAIFTRPTVPEALRALSDGEGDCAVAPLLQGEYLIRKYGLANIEAVGVPFNRQRYCIAVKEGDAELRSLFNEGLGILRMTGEFDDIYEKWFGFKLRERPAFREIMKVALFIIGPVVALLLFIYFWNISLRNRVAAQTRALKRELEERTRAETALSESEEQFSLFMDNLPALVIIAGEDTRALYANATARRMFHAGFSIGQPLGKIKPSDISTMIAESQRAAFAQGAHSDEIVLDSDDGDKRTFEIHSFLIRRGDREHLAGTIALDITARKQLEARLHQSQKMELVGRLAGGIAHDFNNLLTVIIGNVELALLQSDEDGSSEYELREIMTTAKRAEHLVRQLLTFSRRHYASPKVLSLNRVIDEMYSMLRRLLTEHISLEHTLAADLWPVRIDPGQIEQVVVNLVVNARDAMPDGGTITLATGNVNIAADEAQRLHDISPGHYVRLSVSDTGRGMDRGVRKKVFEPFFTTKGVGEGSGLGLSICYGVVNEYKGHIDVASEPGKGTTVELLLPASTEDALPEESEVHSEAVTGGQETILVVEDELAVRQVVTRTLSASGYRILDMTDPQQALQAIRDDTGDINLLVTDVIMPVMGGVELAQRIRTYRPGFPILFISGYTHDLPEDRDALIADIPLLHKPFSPDGLRRAVRDILDSAD